MISGISARRAATVGLVSVVALVGACLGDGSSPPPTSASPSASPSSGPTAAEISEARAVRNLFGLKADEAWIRRVAADPAAQPGIREFGIPLTPAELADLQTRQWDEDLLAKAQTYCRTFSSDCAGAYINLDASGVAVDVAHQVARHRRALRNLAADPSLVEVREVEWSIDDLDGFRQRVEAERGWFEAAGLRLLQVDRRVTENFVHADFVGPTRDSARVVEAHFGNPTWLRAEWYPEPWEGPTGDLVIKIVDQRDRPVSGIRCVLEAKDDVARALMTDTLFESDANGECHILQVPAVRYKVSLRRFDAQTGLSSTPARELEADVAPGKTLITVDLPAGQ